MRHCTLGFNKRPWSIGAFRLLTSIIIALQLMLPSIALASSSADSFSFGQSPPLDHASVSLWRLVVTYTTFPLAP